MTGTTKALPLFDSFPEPRPTRLPARRSDPETSHKAAAKIELTGNKLLFVLTLKAMAGKRTAAEVAAAAFGFRSADSINAVMAKRDTLRKRAKELVRIGAIAECQPRVCRVNGNEATTYEVVQ